VILCDLSRQEPAIVNRESFDLSRPVIRRQRTVADYEFPDKSRLVSLKSGKFLTNVPST